MRTTLEPNKKDIIILTIDDEKNTSKLYKDLLEYLGYIVFTANGGQEGLDIYIENQEKISLVIMDMLMPGLSGSDTFDMLREINPNIKVIISSGCCLTDVNNIMKNGYNGFIQKPFLLEDLSRKIREILNA